LTANNAAFGAAFVTTGLSMLTAIGLATCLAVNFVVAQDAFAAEPTTTTATVPVPLSIETGTLVRLSFTHVDCALAAAANIIRHSAAMLRLNILFIV